MYRNSHLHFHMIYQSGRIQYMDWENRHFVPFSMLMWHVQEDYSGGFEREVLSIRSYQCNASIDSYTSGGKTLL